MATTVEIRPIITRSQKAKLQEIKQRLSAFIEVPSGRIPVGEPIGLAIEVLYKMLFKEDKVLLPQQQQHLQLIAEIKSNISRTTAKEIEDIPTEILINYAKKQYQESDEVEAIKLYHNEFVTKNILEYPDKLKISAVFL